MVKKEGGDGEQGGVWGVGRVWGGGSPSYL